MTGSVLDINVIGKDSKEHALQALWGPIKWFLGYRLSRFVISVHKNVTAMSKLVPFFQRKHNGQHFSLNGCVPSFWIRQRPAIDFIDCIY